jgi:hypothetical protein
VTVASTGTRARRSTAKAPATDRTGPAPSAASTEVADANGAAGNGTSGRRRTRRATADTDDASIAQTELTLDLPPRSE